MAKKKLTHQSQHPKQQNPQDQNPNLAHPQNSSMEDPEDKLQNLKSLNAMLLKETLERRQQVESLTEAKKVLESQLGLIGKEKMDLENELSVVSEERVSLEIEKGLFRVFIETQVDDMGFVVEKLVKEKEERENEIGLLKNEVNQLIVDVESEREKLSLACRERDVLSINLDNWKNEANALKKKVTDMEDKEKNAEEEIMKVKVHCSQLIKQNQEIEKQIEEAKKLRDLAEIKLGEKVKELEDLNRDMAEIVRKNNEIEREKGGQRVRISELEKDVSNLNEIVSSLRKEEDVLRGTVLELEKSYGEAIEKVNVMAMEIDALAEEKKEKERTIEMLMEETDSSEKLVKNLNIAMMDKDGLIEKLLRQKKEIEDVKVSKESEIVQLHKELCGLRDAVFVTQDSIKNQEDKNKQLVTEVNHYRDEYEQARLERDNAVRNLDEEKKNGFNLTSKVLEMEKMIEETVKEFAKMKTEYENLLELKKEMEGQVSSLMKEKDMMQKNFLDAEREIDALRTKLESVGINSDRALAMLKKTVAFVCPSNDGKEKASITEKKLDGEIEPFVAELEIIKNAFRNRETVVEEMKQQVEFLQNSEAEAQKKKGIWAVVSSATTFLAAASLAYAARMR
ncbi:Ubiquitin-protein ligase BRE1A, putative [Ricinus communis]|uniref:Ubiquitin-protein ligase BRE1A, putative n=1 Tax=Ricinus communis TaxID=3988 RepID=B9REZ2_RICCO|nr:Ubiquitin-protein ligase BRE1A, putative [Ricinus communis]|eukprot:XP_002512311.1 interaptin [Ricinus communis]